MSDAASFDAIMQCNLLEVFCEALGAAVLVTDKLDEISFASVRLLHFFPIPESAIAPGNRARDLYGALFDAGCRLGASGSQKDRKRDDWIAERVAAAWKERVDMIEQSGPDRWFRFVSRRFASGLGLTVIQDISEHKKKEIHWRAEQERVRMTEEILDTLPVAIAIKDRNLNFAAVNQQFCKMLKVTSDNVLGRGIWDIFEPGLAASLEESDWHLLATGDDRECIIKVERTDSTPTSFLHRARRIGRPGHHYLSMSFDEFPALEDGGSPAVRCPDLTFQAATATGVAAGGDGRPLTSKKPWQGAEERRKVVFVDITGLAEKTVLQQAATLGLELCVIRAENEFAAFLPAIRDAGIRPDLIAITADAPSAFAALAERYDIPHVTLAPGGDMLKVILAVLEPSPATSAEPEALAEADAASKQAEQVAIDILAIEDNAINRLALEQILESLGLNFAVTANGGEALGKIPELRPRMILADTTLPDLAIDDIVPAIETLLAQNGLQSPIIGLLVADGAEPRQHARSAGFADTLAKPLSPDAVDQIIRKHLLNEPVSHVHSARSAA